jgi:hypothetical protein
MEEILHNVTEERHTFRIIKSDTSDALAISIPMKVRKSVIRVEDVFDEEGNIKSGIYDVRFYKINNQSIHIKITRVDVRG